MQTLSVLVVDDDLDHHAVCDALLGHAGYRVLHAYDGAQGVSMARHHRPDVVLMDLLMPRVDGVSARRALEGDADTRSIPVVAFTADLLRWTPERALAEGFAGHLPKPCALEDIVGTVSRFAGGEPIPILV